LNAVTASADVFAAAGEPVGGMVGVRVWDAKTAKVTQTYPLPPTVVYSLSFSPDGRHLAAGCGDGFVRVWRLPSGQMMHWRASDSPVLVVAFSPDSRTLASAGADQSVRLWEMNTGRLLRSLKGHGASVFSLAFDAKGTRLASGDADGAVLLWDLEKATVRSEWRNHQDAVSGLAFVPGGDALVSVGWDGRVLLTDTTTEAVETVAKASAVAFSVAVSPGGEQLAVSFSEGAKSGTLRFWHLPTKTLLASFDAASNRSIAYLEGAFVAGTASGEVRLWSFEPTAPSLLVPDSATAKTFRWNATPALGYELQIARTLPFRDDATSVVVTRETEWTPSKGISEGEVVYWRVRSLGFGNASPWSEVRSVRWTKNENPRPVVRVRASEASVKVGEAFRIDVLVEGAVNLAGYEFSLLVEPPLMAVTEVLKGDALGGDGVESFWNVPVVAVDASALRITKIAGARLHAGGVNVEKGKLVSVRAKALRAGEVVVRLANLRLVADSGGPIDVDVYPLRLTIVATFLAGDVNRDGVVDVLDLVFVAQRFGLSAALGDDRVADVNGDGVVNVVDLTLVVRQFGESSRPPSTAAVPQRPTEKEAEAWRFVRERLERLPQSVRQSREWEAAMRLVRLYSSSMPSFRLELAPNYPNPFNPETWVPFRLGERAFVAASVLNLRGDTLRRFELGGCEAGSYLLHWDGRADDGTPCASGVYVIRIEVRSASDGMTFGATRRVVLSK